MADLVNEGFGVPQSLRQSRDLQNPNRQTGLPSLERGLVCCKGQGNGRRIGYNAGNHNLTGPWLYVRLHNMDDADKKLLQKIFSLPPEKQQKLCDAMGGLLTKLKTDWEARPENAGKTVTYTRLWDEHAKKMKNGKPS